MTQKDDNFVHLLNEANNSNTVRGWHDIIKENNINYAHTVKELKEAEITEVPFLVDDLIPRSGISIIGGDSAVGKGMIVKQLVNFILLNKNTFLNETLNCRYNSAIYISTEENFNSCAFRIQRQLSDDNYELDVLNNGLFILAHQNLPSLIDTLLTEKAADCVIIDPLGNLFKGDSNSMVKVRNFFQPYRDLELKHDTAFIFIHHTNKRSSYNTANKNDLSGSHAIPAVARQVLLLKRIKHNPTARKLEIVKANDVSDEVQNKVWKLSFGEDFNFVVDNSITPSNGFDISEEAINFAIDLHKDDSSLREIAAIMKDKFDIDRDHNYWYRVLNDT